MAMIEHQRALSKAELAMTSEEDMLVIFRYRGGGEGVGSVHLNVTEGPLPLLQSRWDASIANITITIFAAIIIFCTLAGNTLVIAAVIKERRLRKVSNSFVINLAVSDILVGTLVTPIALVYQLHSQWIFSKPLCDFWVSVDVTCCTASITNLCAISYDRYNAITEPLRYARKRTLKRAVLLILGVWVYSICIAVPPFFGWRDAEDGVNSKECKISRDVGYTIYSTIGAFYLPLLFMVFAYICIYRETSKRTRQWKRGPGSSKMISERDSDQDAVNIRMMQLAGETQPLADTSPPRPRTSSSGTGGSLRRGSGSGVFLRNSSLVVRHSIPYESAILEVDENTRKEGSSSSGSSSTTGHAAPSTFQTTAIAHPPPTSPTGVIEECTSPNEHRPTRRSYGSFPRKLIRQISNLPSSDSSTATSSSSANTTSSSDLPPDASSLDRRFSSVLLRQNTLSSLGDRKDSLAQALHETGHSALRRHEGTPRKSVSFLTPPSQGTTDGSSGEKSPSPSNTTDFTIPSLLSQTPNSAKNDSGKSGGGGGGHHKRKKISVSQEKRAAKTLSIVMGGFIVCWLPFFLVALIEPLCGNCHFPPTLIGVVLWLGYCNSALNPIIYTFFNKDFRFAFKKILRCSGSRRPTRTRAAAL